MEGLAKQSKNPVWMLLVLVVVSVQLYGGYHLLNGGNYFSDGSRALSVEEENEFLSAPDRKLASESDLISARHDDLPTGSSIESIEKWAQQQQLNVVILYPDDWRHDDLQDTIPILQTPFFSKLAKNGIRFTQNAVTTSICWISRATLFTGQWVSRHASTYLFRPRFAEPQNWKKTWPYLLQQAGYFVGHVGKWQYKDVGDYKDQIFNFSSYFEGYFFHRGVHIATHAKDEALRFLRERPKDQPFALTVAFYPPKGNEDPRNVHPYFSKIYENVTIPEPYPEPMNRSEAYRLLPPFLQSDLTEARKRYHRRFSSRSLTGYQVSMRSYYGALTHLDKMCEMIVDELHEQEIFDKTMIIVTADNGEFHSRHALADKWYPYQEAIRVPLIIHDPRMDNSKRGTLNDDFTLNVDLATTILGAAGVKPDKGMQGRDIADLYLRRKSKPWRKEFYYEFPTSLVNIPSSRALVQKEWKYIWWPQFEYEELFNLKQDPFEFRNLAGEQEKIKNEMKERLRTLQYETMAPNIPGTKCDPLWPPKSQGYRWAAKCSIDFPTLCCNATSLIAPF